MVMRLKAKEMKKQTFGRSIGINLSILRLHKEFPDDVGIFAAFLFDCFCLNANSPHCFECVACSANVVRAGLTQNKRLVSYYLFGLVSDSDSGGAFFVSVPHFK